MVDSVQLQTPGVSIGVAKGASSIDNISVSHALTRVKRNTPCFADVCAAPHFPCLVLNAAGQRVGCESSFRIVNPADAGVRNRRRGHMLMRDQETGIRRKQKCRLTQVRIELVSKTENR